MASHNKKSFFERLTGTINMDSADEEVREKISVKNEKAPKEEVAGRPLAAHLMSLLRGLTAPTAQKDWGCSKQPSNVKKEALKPMRKLVISIARKSIPKISDSPNWRNTTKSSLTSRQAGQNKSPH